MKKKKKCSRANNHYIEHSVLQIPALDKGLTMAIMVSFCAAGVRIENCALPSIDAIT